MQSEKCEHRSTGSMVDKAKMICLDCQATRPIGGGEWTPREKPAEAKADQAIPLEAQRLLDFAAYAGTGYSPTFESVRQGFLDWLTRERAFQADLLARFEKDQRDAARLMSEARQRPYCAHTATRHDALRNVHICYTCHAEFLQEPTPTALERFLVEADMLRRNDHADYGEMMIRRRRYDEARAALEHQHPLAHDDKVATATKDQSALRPSTACAPAIEPEWVINNLAELGVKIGERFFFLYKGGSLEYTAGDDEDEKEMLWRHVFKREFGECCWPVSLKMLTSEYHKTDVGSSDDWKPLPLPEKRAPASPHLEEVPVAVRDEIARQLRGVKWAVPDTTPMEPVGAPTLTAEFIRAADALRQWSWSSSPKLFGETQDDYDTARRSLPSSARLEALEKLAGVVREMLRMTATHCYTFRADGPGKIAAALAACEKEQKA